MLIVIFHILCTSYHQLFQLGILLKKNPEHCLLQLLAVLNNSFFSPSKKVNKNNEKRKKAPCDVTYIMQNVKNQENVTYFM